MYGVAVSVCPAIDPPDDQDRSDLASRPRRGQRDAVWQPHRMFGSVTRKNVCSHEARASSAASSSSVPLLEQRRDLG
jgi:hypothetical protein